MSTSQPGDERPRLFGEKTRHFGGKLGGFVSFQKLPRLERHGVHAGDAPLEAVFADLMMKPGNVARVDCDDAAALPQLTGVEH